MLYENEKEAEMVPRAFEKETFLLSFDTHADWVSRLFYLFEERCLCRFGFGTARDERDRGAPYHFPMGQGGV